MKHLREMYLAELRDSYATARTLMPVVTELAREARDPRLSQALIDLNRATARGIDRMGDLFRRHGADPSGAASRLAQMLADSVRNRIVAVEFADPGTRDMAILAEVRRMMALSGASWATLAEIAARLDTAEDLPVLTEGLAEVRAADVQLDTLARDVVLPAARTGDEGRRPVG